MVFSGYYIFALIMLLPYGLLIFSGGDISTSYFGYVIGVGYSLVSLTHGAFLSPRVRLNIIQSSTFVLLVTAGATISTLFQSHNLTREISAESILRILAFCLLFLSWAKFRNIEIMSITRAFTLPSFMLLLAIFFQTLYNPQTINGRHLFLGNHPNLGGEIIFTLMFFLVCSNKASIRIISASLSLYLLYLLQSRAAFISVLTMFLAIEANRINLLDRFASTTSIKFVFYILLLFSMIILFSVFVYYRLDSVLNNFLLLDNEYRGLGSGWAGRIHTFQIFYEKFSFGSIIGAGLDQHRWLGKALDDRGIHNGFLIVVAELGIFGFILIFLYLRRIFIDRRLFFLTTTRLCFVFIFFFGARSINLGLFTLMFWVLILDWKTSKSKVDI